MHIFVCMNAAFGSDAARMEYNFKQCIFNPKKEAGSINITTCLFNNGIFLVCTKLMHSCILRKIQVLPPHKENIYKYERGNLVGLGLNGFQQNPGGTYVNRAAIFCNQDKRLVRKLIMIVFLS